MRLRRLFPVVLLAGILLGPGTLLAGWRLPCPCGRILQCCCEHGQKAVTGSHCALAGARPTCDLQAGKSFAGQDRLGTLGLDPPPSIGAAVASLGPVAHLQDGRPVSLLPPPPVPPPRLG